VRSAAIAPTANGGHNGREDGEQSFRHVPCFTGFAVVRA
jgi:hypothetical protein